MVISIKTFILITLDLWYFLIKQHRILCVYFLWKIVLIKKIMIVWKVIYCVSERLGRAGPKKTNWKYFWKWTAKIHNNWYIPEPNLTDSFNLNQQLKTSKPQIKHPMETNNDSPQNWILQLISHFFFK